MTNSEKAKMQNRLEDLISRVKEIEKLFPGFDNPVMDEIHLEFTREAQAIQQKLAEKREYLFNFKGGGWNSEYAHTMEEAVQIAKLQFQGRKGFDIDEKSFRVSTPTDIQNLLSFCY